MYVPGLGQYLSPDPEHRASAMAAVGPAAFNYAGGRPLVNTDSFGREVEFRFTSSLAFYAAGSVLQDGTLIDSSTPSWTDPRLQGYSTRGCKRCEECGAEFTLIGNVDLSMHMIFGAASVFDTCGRTRLERERDAQTRIRAYLNSDDALVGQRDITKHESMPACKAALRRVRDDPSFAWRFLESVVVGARQARGAAYSGCGR
jgi:hypothetical protein